MHATTDDGQAAVVIAEATKLRACPPLWSDPAVAPGLQLPHTLHVFAAYPAAARPALGTCTLPITSDQWANAVSHSPTMRREWRWQRAAYLVYPHKAQRLQMFGDRGFACGKHSTDIQSVCAQGCYKGQAST